MELFKFYELPFHRELSDQQTVLDTLKPIKDDIRAVEKEIEDVKKFKEYFLGGMMI